MQNLRHLAPIDQQAIWSKGRLETAEDGFVALVTGGTVVVFDDWNCQ